VTSAAVRVGLNAVIVALDEDRPVVLTVSGGGREALPFGPFDPGRDRSLQRGVRRWVRERTGIDVGYLEQLYTFPDRLRETDRPQHDDDAPTRTISIGYLALVRDPAAFAAADARWVDWYRFFPWEDARAGRPASVLAALESRLRAWARTDPALARDRTDRIDLTFGLGKRAWNDEAVLERYELLYEADLVPEAAADRDAAAANDAPFEPASGEPMILDHRRMLATAISRLRGKIRYRPVIFDLLPTTFTLWQMQRAAEAIAGLELHKGNFRRLVEAGGLVEPTGRTIAQPRGRPAAEFRFRRELLREREVGVRLRAARAAST
jgi:hypothetical protein